MADWMPIESAPSSRKVLAYFQTRGFRMGRTIVAVRYEKFQREDESDNLDGADYDEAKDAYFWPAGWYEVSEVGEAWNMLDEEITHWMPLPPPPVETGAAT